MRTATAFVVLCTAVFLCTAPGRIVFPDDEIVFQTTRSLWHRRALAIEGIPKRTGEPKGRPTGTFGWAPGRDAKRYGFFGHGLSVAALPAYGLGRVAARQAPPSWRHAIRSDHYFLHPRSQTADWTRLMVSLTNTFITAVGAWVLVLWLRALEFDARAALGTGLVYALGTAAWPHSRTFLSEPLSTLLLLMGAVAVAQYHRARPRSQPNRHRWLWAAAVAVGLSIHVHVLNVVAIPAYLGYALWPLARARTLRSERRSWIGALLIGTVMALALAWSHFARFGDPLETGRYGLYSHFVVPAEGLLALVVSPGRSFLLYSPPVVLALWGWRRWARAAPAAAWFALALVITRWVFVAARSDWWGGWALGPRFLVPAIPFAVAPLVVVLAGCRGASVSRGVTCAVALLGSVILQAHLASHSIFEWMLHLHAQDSPALDYLARSHWTASASPIVGFFALAPDMLSLGSLRLAQLGEPGLAWIFAGILVAGAAAAVRLGLALRNRGDSGDTPEHRSAL